MRRSSRHWRPVLAITLLAVSSCGREEAPIPQREGVVAMVDSALRPLFEIIKQEYEADFPERRLDLTFGETGTLVGQIETRIRVDLFVPTAGRDLSHQMDPGPRILHTWLIDHLVVVRAPGSLATLDEVAQGQGLVAMCSESTNLGVASRLALRRRDVWQKIRPRTQQYGGPIEAANHVGNGEVRLGVVPASAAATRGDRLEIIEELSLPEELEITYGLGPYTDRGEQLAAWMLATGPARRAAVRLGYSVVRNVP